MINNDYKYSFLTDKIIGASIKVHTELGPGLLESAYKECLAFELSRMELKVFKEYPLPLVYQNIKLECGYRADLYIEKSVIIEVKSVEGLNDLHLAQTLTYLKLANCQIGLLINFNVLRLKDGIRRVMNKYYTNSLSNN